MRFVGSRQDGDAKKHKPWLVVQGHCNHCLATQRVSKDEGDQKIEGHLGEARELKIHWRSRCSALYHSCRKLGS